MGKRMNISSGAKWEDIVGYSRAVRVGNTLEITGTVALKDGEVVGKNDPYLQLKGPPAQDFTKDSITQSAKTDAQLQQHAYYNTGIEDTWGCG